MRSVTLSFPSAAKVSTATGDFKTDGVVVLKMPTCPGVVGATGTTMLGAVGVTLGVAGGFGTTTTGAESPPPPPPPPPLPPPPPPLPPPPLDAGVDAEAIGVTDGAGETLDEPKLRAYSRRLFVLSESVTTDGVPAVCSAVFT